MLKKLLLLMLFGLLLTAAAGVGVVMWGYYYISRDLPRLAGIEDYRPPAVTSVLAADGTLIAEFYRERRYPVKLREVPVMVRNAFLAAEDAGFYKHPGIDPVSIVRAFVKNLQTGSARQGGSTITQQVVKNILLTPEKNIKRKIKEAILSYRLEERFSKDEILEIYLNQIFFGNNAYGIKSAALIYFHKPLDQVTLGEAAMLAGLPKAPTRYSPILNYDQAKRRQRYVLGQMVKAGFVTQPDAEAAEREKIRVYPADPDNIYLAPYFASEVRRIFTETYRDLDIDQDGLEITTSLDPAADRFTEHALRKGLREVDKRRGWRGPLRSLRADDEAAYATMYGHFFKSGLEEHEVYPALVEEVQPARGTVRVRVDRDAATIDLKKAAWARKRLDAHDRASFGTPEGSVRVGDVIEVSFTVPKTDAKEGTPEIPAQSREGDDSAEAKKRRVWQLDQTPDIEGAAALLDPNSGRVLAAQGGYSYQRSQFNRVTQSFRQPGSSFKPIVYLAAVDAYKYGPTTIVYDAPRTFRVGDEYWTPGNFDSKFLGPITLRSALEKSRNLVSADLVSRIGIDAPIAYARKLGITSKLGRNLSLSLGSSELTLLEITRAYGVFAARGILVDSTFITKIRDRAGKVLYDWENERAAHTRQAIPETSAFIMANMMRGVVERGTAYIVKQIKRPAAGKTGTSNDSMDAWFVGYTPNYAAGVWVGFDVKKKIGEKETGGKIAAPIWLDFMREYLNYLDSEVYRKLDETAKQEAESLGLEYEPPAPLEPADFTPPDGVEGVWVGPQPGGYMEYFIKGQKPIQAEYSGGGSESGDEGYVDGDVGSYLDSPDL